MTVKTTPDSAPAAPIKTAGQITQTKTGLAVTINRWFENHWLLTFNAGWGIFVTLPWLAPIFMTLGWTGPGRAVYFVYNFFCHQLPERSWFLFGPGFSYTQAAIADAWGRPLDTIANELVRRQFIGTAELGWKVAWSDRMISMYGSIFLFGLLYALLRRQSRPLKGIAWWLFFIFILPLGLDGVTHLINDALRLDFRQTNDWAAILTNNSLPAGFYDGDGFGSLNSMLRLVTGILFGFGVVAFLWPLMDKEFSPKSKH
jgi:uncharacterized membrane protein